MRKHKYNATKTALDGIVFDSAIEARRYQELKLLVAAGEITDLQLQPAYQLQPGYRNAAGRKQRPINYVADFAYMENGRLIVEDVKGVETAVFRLKRRMFEYLYQGIELRITK